MGNWYWGTNHESFHTADSREEAIEAIVDYWFDAYGKDDPMPKLTKDNAIVGQCVPVDPGACVREICLDDTLEQMEEYAADEHGSEDNIFNVADEPEAKLHLKAISEALSAWARKYIKAKWYTPVSDEDVSEEVTDLLWARRNKTA